MTQPTISEMIDFLKREAINQNFRDNLKNATGDSGLIDDLGADSLDWPELWLSLEDEYEVTIPLDGLTACATLADVHALLVLVD